MRTSILALLAILAVGCEQIMYPDGPSPELPTCPPDPAGDCARVICDGGSFTRTYDPEDKPTSASAMCTKVRCEPPTSNRDFTFTVEEIDPTKGPIYVRSKCFLGRCDSTEAGEATFDVPLPDGTLCLDVLHDRDGVCVSGNCR
jgi:hypothetical protein